MRVVNLVTQMEAGGAQGAAMRMTAGLREKGHDAETWFLYQKRPTYVQEPGIRVMLNHAPSGLADYAKICWNLVSELRRYQSDAVITYTHYANVLGQLASALVGVRKRVASQRNPAWRYPRVVGLFDRFLGAAGLYTTNIAVSHTVRESFSSHPKSYLQYMRVVHNGIEWSASSLSKERARSEFSLPVGVPLVVNVGRLADQKNQDVLIRAIRRLPNCHLAIAGDGELRSQLTSLVCQLGVSDRVHFLGELPPARVTDFLRCGDVFAFPSRFEAFGFAVVEAAAARLPVVISDIPAAKEIFGLPSDGQVAALVVETTDEAAWATAIGRVLADTHLANELTNQGAERAKLFSLQRMIDSYESCLR